MGHAFFKLADRTIPATRHEADIILVAFTRYGEYFSNNASLGVVADILENKHSNSNHDEIREMATALRQVHSRMLASSVEMHRNFASTTLQSMQHDFPVSFIRKSPDRLAHFIRGRVERENTFRSELSIQHLDPFVIISICDKGHCVPLPQRELS